MRGILRLLYTGVMLDSDNCVSKVTRTDHSQKSILCPFSERGIDTLYAREGSIYPPSQKYDIEKGATSMLLRMPLDAGRG